MKKRVPIPPQVYAEIEYLSDKTCCICNTRGKSVQIHHINEDPSCNDFDNLILVCLQCHDEIHTTRRLGRSYTKESLIKFRDEWYARVKNIRKTVDAAIVESKVSFESCVNSGNIENKEYSFPGLFENENKELSEFILSINTNYASVKHVAQEKYDIGSTLEIMNGIQIEYTFLESTIEKLKSFYPKNHFIDECNEDIFSKLLKSIWSLAYKLSAPFGMEEAGTIVHAEAASIAIYNMKYLINTLVHNLLPDERCYTNIHWKDLS